LEQLDATLCAKPKAWLNQTESFKTTWFMEFLFL
jgi:hypothetical protein